jgi:hypothetical protein
MERQVEMDDIPVNSPPDDRDPVMKTSDAPAEIGVSQQPERDTDRIRDGVRRLSELASRAEKAPPLDRNTVMRRIATTREAPRNGFPFALVAGVGAAAAVAAVAAVIVSLPAWRDLADPLLALKALPGVASLLQIG